MTTVNTSRTAKSGLLLGIAAIIAACVPLVMQLTSDTQLRATQAEAKASRAESKINAGYGVMKVHHNYLVEDVQELRRLLEAQGKILRELQDYTLTHRGTVPRPRSMSRGPASTKSTSIPSPAPFAPQKASSQKMTKSLEELMKK